MSPARHRCRGCRKLLREDANFCASCGLPVVDTRARRDRRSVVAIGLLFLGVFAAQVVTGLLSPKSIEDAREELLWTLLFEAVTVAAGLAALVTLGRGAWRESLAGPTDLRGLGLGLAVGLLGFAFSLAYVAGLEALLDFEPLPELEPRWAVLLSMVAAPALVEEWLDRGVLWVALRHIVSPSTTILCSAMLFAFSHGWNGGVLLELPHRFAVGLLLGWVRHRTGSLLPAIAGHATLNLLAVLV